MENSRYNPPAAFANMPPVDRAAHLFNCFYPSRAREICKEEGITDEEIQAGAEKTDIEKHVRGILRSVYGAPEYGAWPEEADRAEKKLIAEETARRQKIDLNEGFYNSRPWEPEERTKTDLCELCDRFEATMEDPTWNSKHTPRPFRVCDLCAKENIERAMYAPWTN